MQTFPTSVHSASNSAAQQAELHICLHSKWRGCAGSALLQAAMLAALAAGQLQTTWSGSQAPPSVVGMKNESTEPENSTAEGVQTFMNVSGPCGKRGKRKKEKK